MNDFLKSLSEQFKSASGTSKAIAGMVALALLGILATFAVVARTPHYQILFSGMDGAESARVARSLAEASIDFELSQPPGPFVIYVDESDRLEALRVVAGSGALEHAPGGILSGETGMSTVFMSASERAQVVLKREWQEVERLLEDGLDFVVAAKVQTSNPSPSPFGKETPRTGSVTLQVKGGGRLTQEQARTVSDLVRFALRVEPENLVISDQSGKTLYNGADLDGFGSSEDWLEQKLRYDTHMAEKASLLLADILGPDKARVTVDSSWNWDLSTRIVESTDPKARVAVSEQTSSTKTPQFPPQGGTTGGPAGFGASLADPALSGDAAAAQAAQLAAAAPQEAPTAQTKQDSKQYVAPMETTQTVRTAPVLERLSVSLFLDESLAERAADLTASVKAAVGFAPERGDEFSLTSIAFAVPEAPPEGAEEAAPLLSPMVETLLRRGVEILSALVFLFVLFRGIKGAREIAAKRAELATEETPDAVLERLAKARVEELIGEDPEKVSRILAAWARDEDLAKV